MVAISFSKKPEFPEMIRKGIKDQTIRPPNDIRYEQIQRIRKLQLYWKQRTKECFKIADAELTEIFKILLQPIYDRNRQMIDYIIMRYHPSEYLASLYYPVSQIERKEIMKRDGLTEEEFFRFFHETYGKMENMEFMVIRFKVTNMPDQKDMVKEVVKKASKKFDTNIVDELDGMVT